MRLWILPVTALVGFALVGCNKSPEGGTPNTDSTFKISLPTIPTAITQGTPETAKGSVDRDSAFKKDVKLSVTAPDKLEVKLNKETVKATDADTNFTMTITVAPDAPVGDHKIQVTGTPDGGGKPTTGDFTVKVTAP